LNHAIEVDEQLGSSLRARHTVEQIVTIEDAEVAE
jgi:hypothetical protein